MPQEIFDLVAAPYLGKRIWHASGYVNVYASESIRSFEGHFVPTGITPTDNYFQPHIARKAWGRSSESAFKSLKEKLCKVAAKDEDYWIKHEERQDEKVFVEFNPDLECPV